MPFCWSRTASAKTESRKILPPQGIKLRRIRVQQSEKRNRRGAVGAKEVLRVLGTAPPVRPLAYACCYAGIGHAARRSRYNSFGSAIAATCSTAGSESVLWLIAVIGSRRCPGCWWQVPARRWASARRGAYEHGSQHLRQIGADQVATLPHSRVVRLGQSPLKSDNQWVIFPRRPYCAMRLATL